MVSTIKYTKKLSYSFNKKEDLLSEGISKYYEDRINILFRKVDINKKENQIINIIKKSQEEVNKLTDQCEKGGFFVGLSSYFDLSKKLKENIANYCLILSLYFQNGNNEKALNFFLLMSKYNKRAITFLTSKIITQLTQLKKITDKSKIAAYYSVMTRMMMQVISVLIKISGKLDKSIYENYYITLYFKILYALSKTTIKGGSNELRIHLKNERKYFYLSCLFDLSIYAMQQ